MSYKNALNPRLLLSCALALVAGTPTALWADSTERVQDSGMSAIWALANVSYAGMRAQNNPSAVWRIVAFIFGFPGTLLSFFLVAEGGERAYGVELPRKT